jgi:hypothetical protein
MAKSRSVFVLIVIWYKFQLQFAFILHMVWIAGTQMIQHGTGGFSRGEDNGLTSCGLSLGGMVPLHLRATERSPMSHWIRGWVDSGKDLEVLETDGWFTSTHKRVSFGWFLAPAAADAAVDQLYDALHKMPNCFHVFAIPILMTNRRRKQLLKATDTYFLLRADIMIWDNSQHICLAIYVFTFYQACTLMSPEKQASG